MSEVLEISPRAQEYKPGIKWEIRMLVKRDDVILGTDDLISRKDWVDSLTSIMGKVSIATQNELTSRIQSSEQMNRDLQQVAEELNTENTQLREQIESLKEVMAKKEQQFQQRLQIKETEIKEVLEKQEQLFQEDFQARELELTAELNRTRQSLETKCEVFEREAKQWRTKYVDLESKMTTSNADAGSHRQAKIDLLEMEILKWRRKVDELEQKEVECKKMAAKSEGSDVVNETLSDVKFNIQLLRDQLKNGVSSETPILDDIKKSISSLSDALEEARSDWKQLENDIIKFLETEKQDAEGKQTNQKHSLTLLEDNINHLREELVGVSTQDEEHEKKMPSLTEKFDILIDMVENLQIGQSRLACSISERPVDSEKNTGDYQEKLDTWMQEVRQAIESRSPPPSSDVNSLYDKLLTKIDDTMSELIKNQEETQDEQIKHIKTIANYLQLMTNDIQSSAIPDLPALSQQLEDVVERLAVTENRLSQANSVSKPTPPQPTWTSSPSSSEEFKNMPHISEDDKLAQLNNFVKNTERFMEHVLLVLNRYEGSNPNGMEEIVRRAVKNASKLQIEQVISLQEQHAEERKEMDRKIQRYEENARGYFDKSMEKMHSDLHEFTGVMYEMLERLVLQALEHGENVANGEIPDQQQKSIKSVIDLHVKLSSLNQVLKVEIERLEQEKEDLDENMKRMKRDNNELEKELEKRQVELRSIQSEHERLNKEIQRSRQDSTAQLTKELEPLISQIMKLKKMATITPEEKDNSFMDLDAEIVSFFI
jgi:chromosome segregation ATPase